jgi:AcrR family transcriptional regulator
VPALVDEQPGLLPGDRLEGAVFSGHDHIYAQTQTPEIAAEAGVSTGTFYWYLSDKRQCFVEMMARNLNRAFVDVSVRLEPSMFRGGDLEVVIDGAIEVLFDHVTRNCELERGSARR